MKHYKKMNPDRYQSLKNLTNFEGISINRLHKATGVSSYTLGLIRSTENYEEYVERVHEKRAKRLAKAIDDVAGEPETATEKQDVKFILHDDLSHINEVLDTIALDLRDIKVSLSVMSAEKEKKGWWK